jgi:ABC-2 type transport system permease protein
LTDKKVDGWLIINDVDLKNIDSTQLIVKNSFSLTTKSELNTFIKGQATKLILQSKGITQATIDSSEATGNISMVEENGLGEKKQSSTEVKSAIGLVMSFVIYIFIFIYGSMVMRSAMEEKTNRIVEVIVSSVKPFELMLGKILGVALVGLTQFMAWILLSFTLILGIGKYFNIALENSKNLPNTTGKQEMIQSAMDQSNIIESLGQLPYAQIITVFFLFFLGGYLLYSSVFAAIGSAVNQETDVQQFMFPVSMPLVFGIIIAQSVVFQSPNGELAKIFSMIPFTSPILMCVRAPFGVSWTEIFTSALILYTTFFLMVWLSAKIYRIGILMYGKKPTWKDFAKWIRQ